MTTLRRAAFALAVALLLVPLPALSQPPTPNPRAERIIEALLIWRLVDELDLTEAQIARIFPRIKTLKEIRLQLGRQALILREELRALLRQRPRDEAAIRAKVAELDALRREIETRRERVLREIRAALTVEQQARFVLIQERFEAETLRLLEEVRRLVEQGGGGRQ
ncbi:MAG: periplasmic heavy metal sensor [Armatimonadota bacterium]|nr:periplasmic heavy metal sensor [Armatimonadota bacterium]MDR7447810.1 periplasmic heavy metal sensor [Armatimonadota bacterium]MDR7460687.1 periplasmic heavy metal sensor [Armatimonadota bacterium]MDR7479858.1 periplasmic heavy metal sensor [Armatimonadota bacterium]MDR7489665.1 periplasmic heavy metal sensor [Armatimonadota bacterium]